MTACTSRCPKRGFDVVFVGSNCRVYGDPALPNMAVYLYGKTTEDKDYWVNNKAIRQGQPEGLPAPVQQGKGAGKGSRYNKRQRKWSKPNEDGGAQPPSGSAAALVMQRANGVNVVPLTGDDKPALVGGTSFNGPRQG